MEQLQYLFHMANEFNLEENDQLTQHRIERKTASTIRSLFLRLIHGFPSHIFNFTSYSLIAQKDTRKGTIA